MFRLLSWQEFRLWTWPVSLPHWSISPNAVTGNGASFTVRFQSAVVNGAPFPAVTRTYVLFSGPSGGLDTANACFIEILPGANAFRLGKDSGADFTPAIAGGSGTFASNSKCVLSTTGSQAPGPVLGASADYTATLNVKFLRPFNGPHAIFLLTQGADGSSSGWARAGTYTVQSTDPGPIVKTGEPLIVSTSPVTGTGAGITATGVFGQTSGSGGHYLGYILLLPTPNIQNFNAAGTCLIEYNRLSNGIRLIDNAGTGWLGGIEGIQAGLAGNVLSNASCTVNVAQAVIDIANEQMKVTVPVTYASGFGPMIGLFTQALDVNGRWTDMRQIGSLVSTIANQPTPGPNVSVAQPSANQFQVTATAGSSALAQVHLRISTQILNAPFCHVVWLPPENTIALINDAGTALVGAGFVALGSAGTLANSQCTVNVATATVIQSGSQRTLSISSTTTPALPGQRFTLVNAFDAGGLLTHWRVGPLISQ